MKKSLLAISVLSCLTASAANFVAIIQTDDNTRFNIVSPATGTPDTGTPDAGTPDAGTPDAGTPDTGTPDAGTPDTGTPDTGTPDAGIPDTPDTDVDGIPLSWSNSKWFNVLLKEYYKFGDEWEVIQKRISPMIFYGDHEIRNVFYKEPLNYVNGLSYNPFNDKGTHYSLPPIDEERLILTIKETPVGFTDSVIDGSLIKSLSEVNVYNGLSINLENVETISSINGEGGASINLDSHTNITDDHFHISLRGHNNTLELNGGNFNDKKLTLNVGEKHHYTSNPDEPYSNISDFGSAEIINMPSFKTGNIYIKGEVTFVNPSVGFCEAILNGDIHYEELNATYNMLEIFIAMANGNDPVKRKPDSCNY